MKHKKENSILERFKPNYIIPLFVVIYKIDTMVGWLDDC